MHLYAVSGSHVQYMRFICGSVVTVVLIPPASEFTFRASKIAAHRGIDLKKTERKSISLKRSQVY